MRLHLLTLAVGDQDLAHKACNDLHFKVFRGFKFEVQL